MKTLNVTDPQLRNIAQGLELTYAKCKDNLKNIHPSDEKAPELREYFKDKLKEISEQISGVNELLTLQS